MKKFKLSYCLATIVAIFFFFSCKKIETNPAPEPTSSVESVEETRNEATWISSDNSKHLSGTMSLSLFLGHTASQCGGSCIKILGVWTHLDCRGFGNVCKNMVKCSLSTDEETGEVILTITDSDALGADFDFDFPDRSLFITNPLNNTDFWLNIPEQVLLRENEEEPFIIHNIWFSEEQELENR